METHTLLWYLTLVSANNASSNSEQLRAVGYVQTPAEKLNKGLPKTNPAEYDLISGTPDLESPAPTTWPARCF